MKTSPAATPSPNTTATRHSYALPPILIPSPCPLLSSSCLKFVVVIGCIYIYIYTLVPVSSSHRISSVRFFRPRLPSRVWRSFPLQYSMMCRAYRWFLGKSTVIRFGSRIFCWIFTPTPPLYYIYRTIVKLV